MIRNSVSDWQELSALYEEADALDAEARAAWLGTLRDGRHPLLSQLERMLKASSDARESRFLDAPASGIGLAQAQHAAVAGLRVGAYRLLRPIGEGGMAEVWLAERDDGAFHRQVAIKLLHRQSFGVERNALAQRFARERDILASLAHPNIAALHDAGVTADNQPWLALEYVEGKALTAWCDDERLSIEARVRLFQQVLLAVQHAHAKLVIHRDLKPANILVTHEGTVRLLDFGIAKLLESEGSAHADTELTREGGRPLTLQYTSPEQLLGAPLTTASDVYSAGVVLYELLCGERPYELRHASTARLEDAILEVEPRAPSRRDASAATAARRRVTSAELRKLLADDLDAVVLKALEKTPASRYASIEALAADLERWLQGKPVLSSAPSALHRVRKFVARHRVAVAAASMGVLLLVAASTTAIWKAIDARQEEARVAAARDFFLNVFALANTDEGKVVDMSARDLLEVGRRKAMTELAAQPRLRAEVLSGISAVQIRTGNYPAAESALREVERIYVGLGLAEQALIAKTRLAETQLRMGAMDAAKNSLHEAEVASETTQAGSGVLMKMAWVRGWIALQSGDSKTAKASLQEVLERAQSGFGRNSSEYIEALQDLANAELAARDIGSAGERIASAEELAARTPGIAPTQLVSIQDDRAYIDFASGKVAAATRRLADAAELCERLLGAREESCFVVRARLAAALLRSGEDGRALALVPYLTLRIDDDSSPRRRAEAAILAFRILAHAGEPGASQSIRDRLLNVANASSGDRLPAQYRVNALLVLAEAGLNVGKSDEARSFISRANDVIDREAVKNPILLATRSNLEGLVFQASGNDSLALTSFTKAHAEFSREFGPDHPLTALYRLQECRSLARTGRPEAAGALIDAALPLLRAGMGADSPLIERVLRLRTRIESAARASGERGFDADIFM